MESKTCVFRQSYMGCVWSIRDVLAGTSGALFGIVHMAFLVGWADGYLWFLLNKIESGWNGCMCY
ncbi:MAG TPA: hypothetical protein EYN95_04040 [Methylococcaceae bacterium]|nr:hypothetical protein [Methylococcaceae bacterium]